MNILHVIHRFLPEGVVGGTTTYLRDLCHEQAKKHDVHVFCGGSPRKDGVTVEDQVEDSITMTKVFPAQQDWRWHVSNDQVNQAFEEVLKTLNPDVVHFHTLVLLSNDLPALAREAGISTVYTIHECWLSCLRLYPTLETEKGLEACERRSAWGCAQCMKQDLVQQGAYARSSPSALLNSFRYAAHARPRAMHRCFNAVDRFIAPSQWIKNYHAANGFNVDNVMVCTYGFNAAPYEKMDRVSSDRIRFGYLGGGHPAKGLQVLLDAFHSVQGNAELHVFGLEEDAPSNVNDSRVTFRGKVQGQSKVDAFASLDVIVVPSLCHDNSPLVIYEARAAGLPVIGTRRGGIPELVEEGESGFLVDAGDITQLATALSKFVENPSLAIDMRKHIEPVMSISSHVEQIEALYHAGRPARLHEQEQRAP